MRTRDRWNRKSKELLCMGCVFPPVGNAKSRACEQYSGIAILSYESYRRMIAQDSP